MATESMTLIDRLRNPMWIHSHLLASTPADLDKDQTVADMKEAADEIARLRKAIDKMIGVALGRHDGTFAAAMVHKIGTEALADEQTAREYDPDVAPCDDAEFGAKP